MNEATTQGVRVRVQSFFVSERSDPDAGHYFFAYRVEITNLGEVPVQLLTRHWVITDGDDKVEEVRGDGVVGEQPVLLPGQSFGYTSACPLGTPVGTMYGSYQMMADGEVLFDAVIPPFTLAAPNVLN